LQQWVTSIDGYLPFWPPAYVTVLLYCSCVLLLWINKLPQKFDEVRLRGFRDMQTDRQANLSLTHACLYSPSAEYHRHLARTKFPVPLRIGG